MENHNFPQPVLPDKIYFKVGEVSKIAGLPAHVLRFWETEFKKINPKRTPSGQRLYRKNDVEIILKIKHLLYEKKFTIEGARQFLKTTAKESNRNKTDQFLKDLRIELENIRNIVS
ncbi:MAG: MerR family transcriptional regulator [Desulfobacteraceae bacterium]|nr:MerR family transcriptional regulator [Desulfobacteraceae bacterium]MBU4000980.1 MerR family transcriptional regulator [Pseudomonadota bacterium]MBU4054344.1 MerR family transcriptional regulator [Pseudomonadota bacterium]